MFDFDQPDLHKSARSIALITAEKSKNTLMERIDFLVKSMD
jgi:hypothetical protein